jgi:predicted HAD superfamily Cof-like phosphohydrolase
MSNFQRVAYMNNAFGNPQGAAIVDKEKLRRQCRSIGHEFVELLRALGGNADQLAALTLCIDGVQMDGPINVTDVRDALCDVHVFAYGAHHFMGLDADRDMRTVVDAVLTRFIKDSADLAATIDKHAAKGVTDVYFEGDFPTMVMKSASDQPDAPKGKFLKSASYSEPVFYDPTEPVNEQSGYEKCQPKFGHGLPHGDGPVCQ